MADTFQSIVDLQQIPQSGLPLGHASSGLYAEALFLPEAGLYGTQDHLEFILKFNRNVSVENQGIKPTLPIEVDYALYNATYVKGSGSRKLTFTWTPTANDLDLNGIQVGRVDSITGVRDFDFAGSIRDTLGNAASDAIPSHNSSDIRIDGRGANVIAFSKPTIHNQKWTVKVKFDRDVLVQGKPTIPITFGTEDGSLSYTRGSGKKTLVFQAKNSSKSAEFSNQVGEVILLNDNSTIKDEYGNNIQTIDSDYDQELIINGSNVVLLGSHYEFLRTIPIQELNGLIEQGSDWYYSNRLIDESLPATSDNIKSYLKDYQLPGSDPAIYDVDLYRVAYRSKIAENSRPTTAYGIAAIPRTSASEIPLVSWEHQTVFNKKFAASQSFSYPETSTESQQTFSTRLKIARYAGQGFAVISSDQLGLGNSIENYGYVTKQANQNASLNLYKSSLQLLQSSNKEVSNLFVAGFSSGAVTAMSFVEALEAQNIKVDGIAVTGGPLNLEMNVNGAIWNPRKGTDGNTPDAIWYHFVFLLTAFSLAAYSGNEKATEDVLGKYYEAGRKLYQSDYLTISKAQDGSGILVDGLYVPYETRAILPAKYNDNASAFAKSDYVNLLKQSSSFQLPIASDTLMVYGDQDEVTSNQFTQAIYNWQRINYGKENVELVMEKAANHRGGFLSMMSRSIPWFKQRESVLR